MKICSQCQDEYDDKYRFCFRDGASLIPKVVPISQPTSPDSLPDKQEARASSASQSVPSLSISGGQIFSERKATLKPPHIAVIGVIALLVVGLALYWLIPSTKREIISKIKNGQVTSPQGASAYDLFLKGSLSESDIAAIRQEAKPVLEARGNQLINQLANDGYNPAVNEVGEVARTYEWLDKLEPNNTWKARMYYFQGRQAYEGKDYNGAENNFQQAMRLDPSWALPVNTLARVFMRRNDYIGAQNCYQKAIALNPNWMFPRINLCVLSVENTRNYGLAEEVCRGILQLDPNKAAGHYFLGRALEEQGRLCEALSEYRIALAQASNTTNPGFNAERLNKNVGLLSGKVFCS